jgi:uncharacterized protein
VFDMSLIGLAATGLATLIGGVLQGMTGFGYAVLALPLLGAFNAISAPQVLALAGAPFVCAMALLEFGALDLAAAACISVGRVGGTAGGLWLLTELNGHEILVLFAAIIAVAATLMRVSRKPVPQIMPVRVVAGVASGLMGTAAGVGGPPLAVLYSGREGASARATLSVVYGFGSAVSLTGFAAGGRIHAADLWTAIVLAATLMAGLWISRRYLRHVDVKAMPRLVETAMWMSALVLLAEVFIRK